MGKSVKSFWRGFRKEIPLYNAIQVDFFHLTEHFDLSNSKFQKMLSFFAKLKSKNTFEKMFFVLFQKQ